MKHIALAVVLFAACSADDVQSLDARDTPTSVVYPCAVAIDETCHAAFDVASAVCDRRIACDELYDVPREECIAGVMEGLCGTVTCYAPYGDRTELDACLGEYRAQACDGDVECHL